MLSNSSHCLNCSTACYTAQASAETTDEAVFYPENVNEHFVSESLGAEIYSTGVGFVEANVHDPCGHKGKPSDADHHIDLVLCQLMGKAIDINQSHIGGNTL